MSVTNYVRILDQKSKTPLIYIGVCEKKDGGNLCLNRDIS